MPTLRFATEVARAGLTFVDASAIADAGRRLDGVHVLPYGGDPDAAQIHRQLVILQAHDLRLNGPESLARLLADLARADAAGLAITRSVDTAVLHRLPAARYGIPVLTISDDPSVWLELHKAVTEEHNRGVLRTATLNRELLDLVRHLGRPDGAKRMVNWLAALAGADATVTTPNGRTVVTAPDSHATEVLRPARKQIADLSRTGLGSAALDVDGRQVRLFTVGCSRPAPVLAVAAPAFSQETCAAIATILDLLAAQMAIAEAVKGREKLLRGEETVRRAVLQMLMNGHVTDARQSAASTLPGALRGTECQVFILKTRGDRDLIIRQAVDAGEGAALVCGSPAAPDETIIVAPCPQDAEPGPMAQALMSLIQAEPGRYLGGSGRHRLAETAQAYLEATRALTIARRTPERRHFYVTEVQLARVLDSRAYAWARHKLAPLIDLPEARRDQLLSALRLGLSFTPAAAAKILGTHRNTVARRLAEAADHLNADLQDVVQRAVLGLALEVLAREGTPTPAAGPALPLADLIDNDDVRLWATNFLERLDCDRRPLRETLAAWIDANTRIDDTAAALQLNPATVRAHLRQAEQLLQRRLVTGSSTDAEDEPDLSGAHDAVMALTTLGLVKASLRACGARTLVPGQLV